MDEEGGRTEILETRALNDLVSAIIVQAAIDYVDSCRGGFVSDHNQVDNEAIRQLLRDSYPARTPLPKWMEPPDIFSCVWFLFGSSCLEDIIPCSWLVSPDAIRLAAKRAVSSTESLNHFFVSSWGRPV